MRPNDSAATSSSGSAEDLFAGQASRREVRWGFLVLLVVLLPTIAIEVRTALTRPFWNDEIYSATVASLASPVAIWQALSNAVDTMPPFFYILTSWGAFLISDVHLAYRLPALVGFFCVPVCLYFVVARRLGVVNGWIAALLVLVSGVQAYATEARPYGFVIGCLAFAVLAWQRLDKSRWWALPFAVAITAAVASHYYAVLAMPAFALGEALRWYRTRERRLFVWLAFVVCLTPILAALPLINIVRSVYGGHFWARSTIRGIVFSYSTLTGLGSFTMPAVIVVAAFIAIDGVKGLTARVMRRTGFLPEEAALAFVLIALPLITYVAAKLAHGGLLMRYILPTMLGLAMATSAGVAQLGRSATFTLLAVLILTQGFASLTHGVAVFRGQSSIVAQNSGSPQLEEMLAKLDAEIPVVVSSGTDYTSLAYYSSARIRDRLFTLADMPTAIETVGTDSVERAGTILQKYLPLNVKEFSEFRRVHQRFYLYSTGNQFDYWPGLLMRQGHLLKLRASRGAIRLYEVQLTTSASSG
jgi:hypothetical protein